jgi:NAD+ synthase
MEKIYQKILSGIRAYFKKSGIEKAVVGVSGGVDSALSLRLVADALGSGNITGLLMPEKGLTKKENVRDAVELCKALGNQYHIVPINGLLHAYRGVPWNSSKSAEMNTRARVRAVMLYHYANAHRALVIGTSNKTEMELGYFTKYGDGAVDIEVIGSLYKTQVYALGKYLGLPKSFLSKKPSAELFHGHTDEEELGMSYKDIDAMLMGKMKKSLELKKIIAANKHKTKQIPLVKV